MRNKKIGIMGGTFNPIHYGHLLLAEQAFEECELDEIIFVPSGHSYMKTDVIDAKLRYEMTSIAIEANPHFSISDIEIERQGYTYTFETILELTKEYPNDDFYFIIGADSLFTIEKWKNYNIIFENCKLIVAFRDSHKKEDLEAKIKELTERYGNAIILLNERCISISSTEIREKCNMNKSIRYLTPKKVCEYIYHNKLYL